MGWTITDKPRHVKHYFDAMYTGSDKLNCRLLDSKLYLTHYVALIEIIGERTGNKPIVVTDFILLKYYPNGEFGYKDTGEECFAYYIPQSFLNRLTPLHQRHDLREATMDAIHSHRERSIAHYARPAVRNGAHITFEHPIAFDTFSCQTFRVVDARRSIFIPIGVYGGLVRIRSFRSSPFTVTTP